MKKSEVNAILNLAKGMSAIERGEFAAKLMMKGIEEAERVRRENQKIKNEKFWNSFDEFAMDLLANNGGEMSLTKFEAQMKERRFLTPSIDSLKNHGYTVRFDGFFKISL